MIPSARLLARYAPLTPVEGYPRLRAHQSPDLFALWQAWETEVHAVCDVPYWGIVWPAAQVLAAYLGRQPALVAGKRVLDCGCGGGVTTIAAAAGGAKRALGCDLDPAAILVARNNGAANGMTVEFVCQDILVYCQAQQFDLILVADLFYQKEFSALLFAALETAHEQGAEVIIADSGRPFLPKEKLVELAAQLVETSVAVEGCPSRTVRIYKMAASRR